MELYPVSVSPQTLLHLQFTIDTTHMEVDAAIQDSTCSRRLGWKYLAQENTLSIERRQFYLTATRFISSTVSERLGY